MSNKAGRYHSKKDHKSPNKDHPLYSTKYPKTNKTNLTLNPHLGKTHKSITPLLLIALPSPINITQKLNKISMITIPSISSKTLTYPISILVMITTSMIKLIKNLNDLYQLITSTLYLFLFKSLSKETKF